MLVAKPRIASSFTQIWFAAAVQRVAVSGCAATRFCEPRFSITQTTGVLKLLPSSSGITRRTVGTKRRAWAIRNAKRKTQRVQLYRELVKLTKKTVGYARRCIQALCLRKHPKAAPLAATMKRTVALALNVVDQTERRVFSGESVSGKRESRVDLRRSFLTLFAKVEEDALWAQDLFIYGLPDLGHRVHYSRWQSSRLRPSGGDDEAARDLLWSPCRAGCLRRRFRCERQSCRAQGDEH